MGEFELARGHDADVSLSLHYTHVQMLENQVIIAAVAFRKRKIKLSWIKKGNTYKSSLRERVSIH